MYLSGLEKTELSDFDDTVYYPDIEKLYVSRNPNAIVYTRNYFRSLSDLETMLGLGNYVWVSSHGSKGKVATFDETGNVNGSISVNDFLKYNTNQFANVKLCVMLSCQSAGTTLNVCNAIHQRGAECVIGFRQSIEATKAVEWQKYFVEAQSVGWTVSAAVRYADNKVYSESYEEDLGAVWAYGGLDSHVIYGNENLIYTEE